MNDVKLFDKVMVGSGGPFTVVGVELQINEKDREIELHAQLGETNQWHPVSSLRKVATDDVSWSPKDPFIWDMAGHAMEALLKDGLQWEDVKKKLVKKFKLTKQQEALLASYVNYLGYEVEGKDPYTLHEDAKNIYASFKDRLKRLFGSEDVDDSMDLQTSFRTLLLNDPILNDVRKDLVRAGELTLAAVDMNELADQVMVVIGRIQETPDVYAGRMPEGMKKVQASLEKIQLFAKDNNIPVEQDFMTAKVAGTKKVSRSNNRNRLNMIAEVNRLHKLTTRLDIASGQIKEGVVKIGYTQLKQSLEVIDRLTIQVPEEDGKLAQVTSVLGAVNSELERVLRVLESYYKVPYQEGISDPGAVPKELSGTDKNLLRKVLGSAVMMLQDHEGSMRLMTQSNGEKENA